MIPGRQQLNQHVFKFGPIGKGAQGEVYIGVYKKDQKEFIVAIKLIGSSKYGQRQLITNEYLKQQKYQHPNVLKFFEKVEKNEKNYLILEYCDKGTLTKYMEKMKQENYVNEIQLIMMTYQLLDALNFIHSHNLMHRDIKPDNILIDQNNNIKIADFGLARGVSVYHTLKIGSPYYWAPEMINNQDNYTEKIDVWSLGVLLYELITQTKFYDVSKFTDNNRKDLEILKIMQKKISFKKKICQLNKNNNLQQKWEQIINYLLIFDPAKRPTSKQAFDKFAKIKDEMLANINNNLQISAKSNQSLSCPSPFQPNVIRDISKEPIKVLKSYNDVFLLKKYLQFTISKIKSASILKKKLSIAQDYPLIGEYKQALIFITQAIVKLKLQQLSQQLSAVKIVSKTIIFQIQTYHPFYKQNAKEICKKGQKYCDELIKECNQNLNAYAWKLSNVWKRKQKKSKLFENHPSLLMVVQKGFDLDHKQIPIKELQIIYESLIKDGQVYIPNQKLQKLNEDHLKIYCMIRILANIDQILPETQCKQRSFVNSKLSWILQTRKQKLIQFIKAINQNQS